jgi:flagellar hook-associated protein 3 FlgL
MTPISTSGFYDRAQTSFADLRARADQLQVQVSSGKRLTRSSDDPIAAARLRTLMRADANQTVDAATAAQVRGNLSQVDSTLTSMANLVARARELAIQAANGTLPDSQRQVIGLELGQIHDSLFSLANSHDSNGSALFGGTGIGDAYIRDASGSSVYAGTAAAPALDIGDGTSIPRGLTGPEALTVTTASGSRSIMEIVKQLSDALQTGTDAQGAAKGSLDLLDAGTSAIARAQTVVGTRLAWIDQTTDGQQLMTEQRETEKGSVGGTDLASSIAQLQQTMLVLQASQASFARLSSLTLFDALR